MMLTTHALFGAAIGRLLCHRPASYLAGVASHALGDVLPHREAPMGVDVPLSLVTLALLCARYGPTSPEVSGALGGITPDLEHIPTVLGWCESADEIFPTHGPYPEPWLHSMGRTPKDDRVQIGVALAALLVLCAGGSSEGSSMEAEGKGGS